MYKKILFLFISVCSFAQEITMKEIKNEHFLGKIQRVENFPSNYVKPRNVDVWLPENYSPEKKYSVLYMHDGQMLFDATITWNKQEWQVDDVVTKLVAENKIEDVIVVGVWNIPTIRHLDLFPQKAFDLLPKQEKEKMIEQAKAINLDLTKINSDNYLKFIVKEVKPFVDKQFSTYSDAAHTAVMGSSMGGLISMYAICEYPEIFSKAACLSTHWIGLKDVENNPIPNAFFTYMQKKLPNPDTHKIYFDFGTETLDAFYVKYEDNVNQILAKKGFTEKNAKNLKFEGTDHSENSWQKRIHIPLEFMFGK
nr:alpha/beta hydrolase-fold protein [uncultured Flavobacterium sp.]